MASQVVYEFAIDCGILMRRQCENRVREWAWMRGADVEHWESRGLLGSVHFFRITCDGLFLNEIESWVNSL